MYCGSTFTWWVAKGISWRWRWFFEILLIFHDRIDGGAVGGENHISENIDDDGDDDDDDDADDVSERMMACKFKHRDGKN